MANIKLQIASSVPLVEDMAMAEFELPEFNARTRRSYFVDLFNTGAGSVHWELTPSDPWVQVSQTSGAVTSEERVWISIDWPAVPKGEHVVSSLSVDSAGQTLEIPVTLWNPSSSVPLHIDFVEDNNVIAMEAESYSSLRSSVDAAWTELPNLGSGGVMMVTPTTAASRERVAEITNTSPALVYNTYLRSSGPVTVKARFIPTLAINGLRGLRYAVSFDDEEPQIVDMDRTSGSGIWDRSVLRGHIDYTTTHQLPTAGTHQLKIWMVDPGVVLDRLEIFTGDVPYTYRGAPVTAVENFGSYKIESGQAVMLNTNDLFRFDSITNNGLLTLLGSSALELGGGPFINNGVLDLITWKGMLPGGFVNDGSIVDSLWIENATPSVSSLDIAITGYTGHGYQLQQKTDANLVSGGWVDVGVAVQGEGSPITFYADLLSTNQGFYRIKVFP